MSDDQPGQRSMSKPDRGLKRKITVIMSADIAEFTRITAEDEEETLERLASYREVIDACVDGAGGRVFNTGGDSVMCEFPSAVEATRCAIGIQQSLGARNLAYPPNRRMHFRIGISIGDVVERDGDLLGDGVNIAARLHTLAQPGSICVSRNVQEAVANKISLPLVDLGPREVKNLPYPVHAFLIEPGGGEPGARRPPPSVGHGEERARSWSGAFRPRGSWFRASSFWAPWVAAGIAVAAGGGGLYWMGRSSQVSPQPDRQAAADGVPGTGAATPAQAFDRLAGSGGLVRDARSAAELYHNARLFEARGESANARRDYLAIAALGAGYVDPLLRLAALLRAQDGRAGAREALAGFARGGGEAADLVHILQFEGAERIARLTAFTEAHPDFAPAHMLLAAEFGEDRRNAPTIDDRRRELAALLRFLAAHREGRLVPFFLDQSVLAQWLEAAQRRAAASTAFFAEGRDRIAVRFTRTNTEWLAVVTLPEAATRLEYRLDAAGDYRMTGFLPASDPRTGKAMPKPSFEMPPHQARAAVDLRYADASGALSTTTTVVFDPAKAILSSMRESLESSPGAWLSFGEGQNSGRLFLTQILSHRCAVERLEIRFDEKAAGRAIELPACDPANPHAVPGNARHSIAVQPEVRSVTVRLTFVGGDRSEPRTVLRPRSP